MEIKNQKGPASALGGFFFPLSEAEAENRKEEATHKIQNCFRKSQEANQRFFEANFLALLGPHVMKIPASETEIEEFVPLLYKRFRSMENSNFQLEKNIGSFYGYGRYHDGVFSFFMPLGAIQPFEGNYKQIVPSLKVDFCKTRTPFGYQRTFKASPNALVFSKYAQTPFSFIDANTSYEESGYIAPPQTPNSKYTQTPFSFINANTFYEESGYIAPPQTPNKNQGQLQKERAENYLKNIAQQILDESVQDTVFIVPPPSPILNNLETLPWYPADLSRAINNQFVYLSTDVAAAHPPFTKIDTLKCFLDVAEALSWLHSKGYVHRDVKSLNILVEWSPKKGRYIGVLGDCDTLKQGFGWDDLYLQDENYPFWEITGICNLSTLYVDRYALAVSLLTPNWDELKNWRNAIIASAVMGTPQKLTFSNPALSAAASICYESTYMLLHILHSHRINHFSEILKKFEEPHRNFKSVNDPAFITQALMELVEEHKSLFTHEAIVEAMQFASQRMQREGKTIYTLEKIKELILAEISKLSNSSADA